MRCLTAKEIKVSAFVLGALQSIWASAISFDPWGRLSMMLQLYDLRVAFVTFLATAGAMLMVGSMCPWRKMRHMGLWLSPMITLPTFGILVGNGMIGPMSFTLPLIGAVALCVLFMDAKRKPRAQVDTGLLN